LKILQIVTKNTSTLDYTLPIFWGLKKHIVKSDVSVLYCVGDKKRILRESSFFSNSFRDYGVTQYDYIDILDFKNRYINRLVRRICQINFSDQANFEGLRGDWFKNPLALCHASALFLLRTMLRTLDDLLARKLDFEGFFEQISPDLIILDNRENSLFPGAKNLFTVIFALAVPKIIVPHAPHFSESDYVFSPVNPVGKDFYPECEAWIPFRYSDTDRKHQGLEKHFQYIGYPGFDDEWLESCKKKLQSNNKNIVCLYIGRKFLDQHIKRPENLDYVTMDYDAVLSDLLLIKESFKKLDKKITFIFKPHPSSNFKLVQKVMRQASFDNSKITHEPLYDQIDELDIVISSYSTSVLIPAMAGIPTIIFNSEIQKKVNSQWSRVEDLYKGLSYYIEAEELQTVLKSVLFDPNTSLIDKSHLRDFYPDNAIHRAVDRLTTLAVECNR